MQIALVNASGIVTDEQLVFAAEACQDSLAACAKDWGVESNAVLFYGHEGFPSADLAARVATIVDNIDEAPGAEAYHTDVDGVIFSRVLASTDAAEWQVGLDHENKEELIDPDCSLTVTMPDGRELAKEICDPVQGDTKKVTVTIGGVSQTVTISNNVLPAYFDKNDIVGPYDAFRLVSRPFECRPGGYQEITDPATGKTDYVFGKEADGSPDRAAVAALEAKRRNPTSRLYRRIAKRAAVAEPTPGAPGLTP